MYTISTRENNFDNIKALLIILVVLGHLMEPFLGKELIKFIYLLIYSFHMPLFVFCSGYFAKNKNQKTLNNIILPFIIFQILYLIFNNFILANETNYTLTTPYWILWYLLSSATWNVMLQFHKQINIRTIVLAFIIGLLIGFDNSVGYYLSLSRTLVFYPFFLLGNYCKNNKINLYKFKENKILVLIICLVAMCIILLIYNYRFTINVGWLYNSTGYKSLNYNILIRLIIYLNAIFFSTVIILFTPNIRFHIFTNIGVNSMSIFLFHGFIVKFLGKYFVKYVQISNNFTLIFYIITSTIIIVLLLQLSPFNKFIKFLIKNTKFYK